MRVSKLLKELKISYKRLTRYNIFLETPITSPNQELDEDTYLQIIALYNNKEIQNQLDDLAINDQISNYNGCLVNNQCKFIGKVKWYYNQANDGEYGFAEHEQLKEIFFRGSVVKGVNPRNLRENEDIIFTISKQDFINRDRIKATTLHYIAHETDILFLIYLGILKNNVKCLNRLTEIITQDGFTIKPSTKLEVEQLFSDYFSNPTITIDKVISIVNIASQLDIMLTKEQIDKIDSSLDSHQKFQLFSQTNYLLPISTIEEELIEYIANNPANSQFLLSKLDSKDLEYILEEVFNTLVSKPEQDNYHSLIEFVKWNAISIDYTKLSDEQITILWLNNLIENFPLDAVYSYLFKIKAQLDKTFNKETIKLLEGKIYQVLDKVTQEEHVNLFYKTYNNYEEIDTIKIYNQTTFFLDYTKDEVLYKKFVTVVESKATDYIKLQLFISDYTDSVNFHDVVIYTGLLSASDQKLFFKKVLMLIETKVLDLTLIDLNKITTYNYTDNQYAKEIDGVGLDFTLSIILKIATDLRQNQITNRNSIFDIIANQIKTPQDLLVIDGFFQKCDGRTFAEETTKTIDGKTITTYYKKKSDKLPRFKTFCDGRKALEQNSNRPLLSRREQMEFWWCENTPCFETCRKPVSANNWRDYTLENVLKILGINYSERQYEIVLSIINRVNRFLEHLKCKCCNTILRPNGRGNYGFYGVSMFSCTNKQCETPDKNVYLSHCMNGKCEDYIDSRESKKCRPSTIENPDNCGWYICNNCYACCSSEKLQSRKSIIEQSGQEYKCHINGHRDRGVLCCSECGFETIKRVLNTELYRQQLDWFISKIGTETIENSGQRQDGKWWFRWCRGDLYFEEFFNALTSLKDNGFQVPNLETGDDVQFIAEPFVENNDEAKIFDCPNCKNVIELSDNELFNFERVSAIKYFHNIIFPDHERT
ncbi:cold-shock protein [Olleya aquimaris]|uniref:Uncharacterized protein n=1 Tax=Olleya aquimaris TaxID=639310 RepID=A0A327RP47_9FLAO|nr:hypothetical protein [Olleya aquimaris]RAJ17828.1 hypothetical protein LY08_00096 [Olleya aquimaris]